MSEQNQNDPYAAAKKATSIGPSSKYEQWIADHPTIAKIANMFAPVDRSYASKI